MELILGVLFETTKHFVSVIHHTFEEKRGRFRFNMEKIGGIMCLNVIIFYTPELGTTTNKMRFITFWTTFLCSVCFQNIYEKLDSLLCLNILSIAVETRSHNNIFVDFKLFEIPAISKRFNRNCWGFVLHIWVVHVSTNKVWFIELFQAFRQFVLPFFLINCFA